jgi:hypothetical protein
VRPNSLRSIGGARTLRRMEACVVCGVGIEHGAQKYPNAWEAARKRFPCCGATCCAAFDPDVHWLPAALPDAAGSEEQKNLLRVSRRRLEDGDSPRVVARELLQAGVAVAALRKVLGEALVAGTRAEKDAAHLSLFGGLFGALAGVFSVAKNHDKRRPAAIEDALSDVDRWIAHFGSAVGGVQSE